MTSSQSLAQRALATGGLMLATLMNTLDSTIANVALPHIQGSVSASPDQITWVLTSYILATAVMTPLTGWLSLKLGRKPLFLASIAAFMAASVLCGMATSLPEMVLFRVLQGFAGASMMPLSQAAMLDLWEPHVVPRVMAVWSSVIVVGPILGPTLGGFLTEHYSWRWVFYINVPVAVFAFLAVFLFLERDRGGRQRPFDFLGFAALVAFTTCAQLLLDRGSSQDWFDSREIWIEAIGALCALYVFLMQTLTAEHPFFHRDVLADRNFLSSQVCAFFVAGILYSTSAMLPAFMQNLLGYSALQSGVASTPRGVGSLLSFALAPFLAQRWGPRPTILIGVAATLMALYQFAHFDLSMTARSIETAGFVQGFGMGLMFNPLNVLAFATLSSEHRTEAAVLSNVARNMGGSIGIAGLQALLIRQIATAHERLAADLVPTDPLIRWRLPQMFDTPGGLEALNAELTRQGAMIGYDTVFGWMCAAGLLIPPLLLLMRPAKPGASKAPEAHME